MFNLLKLINDIKLQVNYAKKIDTLNNLRNKYISKNGVLTKKINKLLSYNIFYKKKYGFFLQNCKFNIIKKILFKKKKINEYFKNKKILSEIFDYSLPGRCLKFGSLHPISSTICEIENFFENIGFQVFYGPEIEDVYHNFDSLNIFSDHPARDMHDTFWLDKKALLRTQTSSMQVRIMQQLKPPVRLLFPGKVFRKDLDSTHTPMFHQIEGLIIDKNINFSNLKWILEEFLNFFFDKKVHLRFRTSYFPFTVPSAEVDIKKKNSNWLEILGCGMVHPKVLQNMNVNTKMFKGCAFGIGVERIILLRHDILDIRTFFENDLRFLSLFK
ncbi:phenylalanine--tRNA ligase subunit alpha [Buchnera aphidicola (Mollitrichosiphum nigrofasciatum)]|uniref:phenylalanine--tRNA ligase subunit alpha n=1 Tax=Buchnera aphidicola TaxID=9 RepID=UPI0031B831A7